MISAFTVGGGFVIIPLMKAKFVDALGWIQEREALDMVAISQAAPGVIAVNMAIILGYKLRGWRGVMVTVVATVLPPLIILSLIAYSFHFWMKNPYVREALAGMQVAATALILSVAFDFFTKMWQGKRYISLGMAAVAFVLSYVYHVSIIYIILGCAVIGAFGMRGGKA